MTKAARRRRRRRQWNRGRFTAPRRMRPRPAAPPDAWAGLAAEPAEAGGRPPIGEPLLRGPVGGLDGGVVARVALAGEGPPDIERLRQAVDAGVREPAAAEPGSTPIPSTAFAPPSGGRFPWANRPLRARRGRGGQAPNASPPCRRLPRCARTDPARPPRARRRRERAPRPRDAHARRGRAFRPGAQTGPANPGERERGAGPRRRPRMRLTGSREGGRERAGRPQRPRAIAPRGPSFPSREAKKRGPPSPAGPSGIRGGA